MMLTNGEHDDLWRKAASAIPALNDIACSLRRANALTIAKEMLEHDIITKDCYERFLTKQFNSEGFYLSDLKD